MTPDRVPVLYIVSGTRSGSTLLDTILGSIDGWFSAGELRFLWERGIVEGRRCGCGEPVTSCPVWSQVLVAEIDGQRLSDVHARDVIDLQHRHLRVRHTLAVLRHHRGEGDSPLDRYAAIAERVYRAIADVTNTSVIVDSSKHPSDAALLRSMPSIDPYWVHLVRDPRAVAFSWQRRKPDPDGQEEMPRWSVAETAVNWDAVNVAADALGQVAGKRRLFRVRYEDFVRAPRATVEAITAMLGRQSDALPFTDDRTVELAGNHTVSGNPNRFRTGPVTLRSDDEWVRAQSDKDRRITTGLTAPLLMRYGYPLRPSRGAVTMRILVLHSRYLSGAASGENRVAEDEVALLRAAGHTVLTWTPEPVVEGRADLLRTGASTIWNPDAARTVRSLVREHGIEIVHAHNLFPTLSPAVLRAAAGEGAAVFVTLHNYRLLCLPATFLRDGQICEDCLGHTPWRGVTRRCYRGSAAGSATLASSLVVHRAAGTFRSVTRFLAVSSFVRAKYVQAGFPPWQIAVKPNFSDDAVVRTGPGGPFLYLGRLAEEKGVDTIIAAWKDVPTELVVVGDGPVGDALRANAPANVRFVGHVPAEQVPELLRTARALVVPSRWYEAAPRGITEAYATGVPVLATRIGALAEAVEDGTTGLLVERDDPAAWAEAAEQLLDDATSERLGAAARGRWEERFSPERGLEGLVDAYESGLAALGRRGLGRSG